MTTTAEGVETTAQAEFLLRERCDEAQGYHFGRPMSAEAIQDLLYQLPSATSPLPRQASAA